MMVAADEILVATFCCFFLKTLKNGDFIPYLIFLPNPSFSCLNI
jgi:hypothetical protein